MVKIRYYISDHGLGHASRSVAIIKELVNIPGVRVFARNFSGRKLLVHSFSKGVGITQKQNDFGVINKNNSLSTDKELTYSKLKEWRSTWEYFIAEEKRFCKGNKVDLIVSDISPQPFILAEELGIPSIAVTNFTWHCIYSDLYGKNDEFVNDVKDAYLHASKSIILPFEQDIMPLKNQKKTGLVCRKTENSRKDIRKKLGLSETDFVVFISMGFSMESIPSFNAKNLPEGLKIVSSFIPNAIKVPESFHNYQDIIAASDLVVCKSGYSTVAEAISSRVPIIVTVRVGFVDDEKVASSIEKLGIGMRISNDNLFSFDFISGCREFTLRSKEAYNSLPKRFSSLHNEEVAKLILY